MITIHKDFDGDSAYPVERLGKPESLLFFDIETTGFSGSWSNLYLIGCTVFLEGRWQLFQWFAEDQTEESAVLKAFFEFLSSYPVVVHFNGDRFDIPYLMKRNEALSLPYDFHSVTSIDLYKKIRPFRNYLGLSSLKQKSIEQFLGIAREDTMNGGELIEVYERYKKTRSPELLSLLLLHNEDDLKGMPRLLPVLFYPDFFSQKFSFEKKEQDFSSPDRFCLTFQGDPETILPVPLSEDAEPFGLTLCNSRAMVRFSCCQGEMKHFFPDYKNYYYLPMEDTAIHKSVGAYVDASARKKATKETCFIRKQGIFIPQPEPLFSPDFKRDYHDPCSYFEPGEHCFHDCSICTSYVHSVIDYVFSHKG